MIICWGAWVTQPVLLVLAQVRTQAPSSADALSPFLSPSPPKLVLSSSLSPSLALTPSAPLSAWVLSHSLALS